MGSALTPRVSVRIELTCWTYIWCQSIDCWYGKNTTHLVSEMALERGHHSTHFSVPTDHRNKNNSFWFFHWIFASWIEVESDTGIFFLHCNRIGPTMLPECNFSITVSFPGGWGEGDLGLASLAAVQISACLPHWLRNSNRKGPPRASAQKGCQQGGYLSSFYVSRALRMAFVPIVVGYLLYSCEYKVLTEVTRPVGDGSIIPFSGSLGTGKHSWRQLRLPRLRLELFHP